MLVMFAGFSLYFYYDGSVGYRGKNKVYYLYHTFESAGNEFAEMNTDSGLSPKEWQEHASKQVVNFPQDTSILPDDLELPMPWPDILQDYDRMKSLQWNQLWLEYSEEYQYPDSPSESPYDARKIKEQWVLCYICLGLAFFTGFLLARTARRSFSADSEGIKTHRGKKIPYTDLKTLDLRKWESKGLAYIEYDGASGTGRLRIDGLTYGGFKSSDGAPAEKLMTMIRENFVGEIIEYEEISPDMADDDSSDDTQKES